MSEDDVEAWARLARAGDTTAFGNLVQRLVRPALAAAWEFVEVREDAEDIVQEAFARAFQHLERWDPERAFAPWFFTILRNAARNARGWDRRWDRVPLTEERMDGTPQEDPLDRIDFDTRLHAALAELSPMQRACFRLAEMEGFPRMEVATMLGVTTATVRVHIHRARGVLRDRMALHHKGAQR